MNADYATIEDQRESSRATKDDLSLGEVSFAVREHMQNEENDLPDSRSLSGIESEVLTVLSDLGDMSGWDDISDAASEISFGNLNFPSIESCMMDIEDDSVDFLSDSGGSGIAITNLRNDPRLGCCVSRLGEMGNPLGDHAREQLDGIAYPGESARTPDVLDKGRFRVHPTAGGRHVIFDTFRPFERDVLIDTCLLRHPQFKIDQRYWRKRAESLGRSMREIYKAEFLRAGFSPPVGTPVEERIVFWLTNGVPPARDGLGNEHRFGCLYRAGEESYEIRDHHLMLRTSLPVTLAEYISFNAATWYRRRVDRGTHNEDTVDEFDDDFIRQLENSTINNGVDSDASDLDQVDVVFHCTMSS